MSNPDPQISDEDQVWRLRRLSLADQLRAAADILDMDKTPRAMHTAGFVVQTTLKILQEQLGATEHS